MSFEEVHHLKGGAAGDFPMSGGGGFFCTPRGGAVWEVPRNQIGFVFCFGVPESRFFFKKKRWED